MRQAGGGMMLSDKEVVSGVVTSDDVA